MSGKGPAPKQASARRRSNDPVRGEWVILDRPRLKKPPVLPQPYPKGGYSVQAKAEWSEWWLSPVAPMWDSADQGSVRMLLRMVDEWWDNPTAAMASQIRQFKDTLGLTPKGRQDRRWVLPGEVPPGELTVIDGGKSNVRRLRAVDAG